jgi:hypothetical protein
VADKLTIIEERILREDANGASTQLLTLEAQWAPKFTPLAEIVKRIGPKTGCCAMAGPRGWRC